MEPASARRDSAGGKRRTSASEAVLDIHSCTKRNTHAACTEHSKRHGRMNMNAMLSLCYHMQRAPEAILHQDRMGHVDGRRQTPGRGLRQRDGCWDALGGRASGRPRPLPPRDQEGLRHRGQRHAAGTQLRKEEEARDPT